MITRFSMEYDRKEEEFRPTDLDSPGGGDAVCEVTGVKIALERTDGEDELRFLNLVFDLLVCQ